MAPSMSYRLSSVVAWAAPLSAVLFAAPSARALTQWDGTIIPYINPAVTECRDNNVQICLDDSEGARTFDALATAATTPETYNPLCNLTFHLLARGGGFDNTFGWYNVDPAGGPPPGKDGPGLYGFITCDMEPGDAPVVFDIKNDPRYLGGEIGFFLATPEGATGNCPAFDDAGAANPPASVGYVYYSQPAYNPDAGTTTVPSIHLITYASVTYPDTFYFAWEDLFVTSTGGSDNDFDDVLTRVDGIVCQGGGDLCETGLPGICSVGVMRCQNGELTCVPFSPQTEVCNALDDDCNGETDDGELCDPGYICHRGTCVPYCGGGEFQCPPELVCHPDGVCVDPRCLAVDCPEGEICVAGVCQGACDDVVCPYGQSCNGGKCVDLCEGVVCDTGYVCHLGACAMCECTGCADGEVCLNQVCVEATCETVVCNAGFHCEAGACVDNCLGAACPPGLVCRVGQCEEDPNAGAAGAGGGSSDGGTGNGNPTSIVVPVDAGPTGGSGPSSGGSGGSEASAGSGGEPTRGVPVEEAACGCRIAGGGPGRILGALAALILGAACWSRRRGRAA